MAIPFPELSRKPALKTRESTLDPTLRDDLENGMESTMAQFTRFRRQFDVTIDLLTPADKRVMDNFVQKKAVGGANEFLFLDESDPTQPEELIVKFATLPSYVDKDNTANGKRKTCTFTLREV